ncbi:MAG TPA: hypothetical protein EYQ24_00170 [Bacteroidetes bacterium]|nr:hypothetical protein [Bacteroidota bacterium]HIL57509.1 hypothetical protein [Rhodothermales bacterium]
MVRSLLLALLAVSLGGTASAQDVPVVLPAEEAQTSALSPVTSLPLSGGERAVVYLSGVAGGVIAPILLGSTLNEGWVTVVSVPVGAAFGVHAASQLYGLEGEITGALGNAALGFGIGAGAGVLSVVVLCSDGGCPFGSDSPRLHTAALVGLGLATVTPGLVAAHRRIGLNARLTPAALAAPTGETVAGLSLRVGL